MTTEPIDPSRTALLLLDFQNGIVARIDDHAPLLERAAAALAAAREHGLTIAHVRVAFADGETPAGGMGRRINTPQARALMHADAPGTQLDERVRPQEGEIVVRKTRVGPFGTTDLHEQLQARGIDTLVIGGIATSGAVLSAVRDGHDRDYRLIVVDDLVADPRPGIHELLIEHIIPAQAEVISTTELDTLLGEAHT